MEIREKIENGAAKLEERVRPEIDAVKEKLNDANERITDFIRAHPTPCLLGAVALGFLVGRIARWSARHAGS